MKLNKKKVKTLLSQVNKGWRLLDDNKIIREFSFKDYKSTIIFVNKVADISESQDHHPDINFSYGKVKITLSTHEVGGLSKRDFILAEEIDSLLLQ